LEKPGEMPENEDCSRKNQEAKRFARKGSALLCSRLWTANKTTTEDVANTPPTAYLKSEIRTWVV